MPTYREVSPAQVHDWITHEPDSLFLLDVREPFEFNLCRVEGSRLIPLNSLPQRLAEVPTDVRVVCICHHGTRSAYACQLLASLGRGRLYNLTGGVDRWASDVDPAMPRY